GVAGGTSRGGGGGLPRLRAGSEPGRGGVGLDEVRSVGQPGGERQAGVVGLGGGGVGHREVPPGPAERIHPSDQTPGPLTRCITGIVPQAGTSNRRREAAERGQPTKAETRTAYGRGDRSPPETSGGLGARCANNTLRPGTSEAGDP